MAVNRATNVKLRDADIDRKMRLYGIVDAFQHGKLPSNDQIDSTLNSFLASRALSKPSNKLSAEGRALVADFREVVSEAKYLLLSKNQGNLIQDFIWQTSRFDYGSLDRPSGPVSRADAKQDGESALQGLKTLGKLVITNGQFRKLLKDASVLLRDIVADTTAKATDKVRPSADALAQLDEPAADHTWHEAPNISKDSLKKQTQGLYKKNKTGAAGTGVEDGAPEPLDAHSTTTTAVSTGDADLDAAAKNKTSEYRDRTRNFLQTKMPKERRDQVVWRLKKMVIECQEHPDYQDAMQSLLDMAETYRGHARGGGASGAGAAKAARGRLGQAESDLRTLLERFANGTSTEPLWQSINAIYAAADQDAELKTWFGNIDRFLRRCLQERGYILEDVSTQHWNTLQEQGQYLLREKYRPQMDQVTEQVRFLGEQFDRDAQNKRFAQALQRLFTDLGNDENGKAAFKPHLVKDLTNVILPAALQGLAYIPVPRIEYTDVQVDAVIENLVMESDNFMPNLFEVHNNNHLAWGRKLARHASQNRHAVQVSVAGIQMDMRNVSYYIKRKQGFPALTDMGVVSILLGGQGFGFRLGLRSADRTDPQHFFKVDTVRVDIDHLKIKLHQSRHKLLFNVFKPLLLGVLRPVLQKVLEAAIRENFAKWDAKLYEIKQEADRAGGAASADGAPGNAYSRFFSAAQKRNKDSKARKAEAKRAKAKRDAASGKQFNLAMAREDSILPNIVLPGSFSNKTSEYRAMARRGDDWQSPVFALGSAGPSRDIPRAPAIQKKVAAAAAARESGAGVGGSSGSGAAAGSGSALHSHPALATTTGNTNAPRGGVANGVDQAYSNAGTNTGYATQSGGVGGVRNDGDNAYYSTGAEGGQGHRTGAGLAGAAGVAGVAGGAGVAGARGGGGGDSGLRSDIENAYDTAAGSTGGGGVGSGVNTGLRNDGAYNTGTGTGTGAGTTGGYANDVDSAYTTGGGGGGGTDSAYTSGGSGVRGGDGVFANANSSSLAGAAAVQERVANGVGGFPGDVEKAVNTARSGASVLPGRAQ